LPPLKVGGALGVAFDLDVPAGRDVLAGFRGNVVVEVVVGRFIAVPRDVIPQAESFRRR
jgi:hypothetical protein